MPPRDRRRPEALNFRGERKEFLDRHIDAFQTATDQRQLRSFWIALFTEYWQNFPWRLPIDQEPHCGMLMHNPESYEEVDLRTAIYIKTQARIKAFYFWHRLRAIRRARKAASAAAVAAAAAASAFAAAASASASAAAASASAAAASAAAAPPAASN
ncbi:hypothetical protein C8R47DRAFT_1067216 [Mycena vitilis]|nr:hypothetical protein C8R47DRAFT_1076823 [Mycena vitilis]KAJ6504287.1 hypothetical protein C8R47DRAFT_1067216 [Mycena vitilis]